MENITLGNPNIPLRRVLDVIEQLGLNDFVRESAQGLDTEMLSGGKNTPRSIMTKILVARSVVAKPNLLVMEEPLAGLNFRDRLRIAQFLADRNQPWTLVCVTEDPVLAALCDRVLILKEGEIALDGSFEAAQKSKDFERVFRSNLV